MLIVRTLYSSINVPYALKTGAIHQETVSYFQKRLQEPLRTFLTPEFESSKLEGDQSVTNFNDMDKSIEVVRC